MRAALAVATGSLLAVSALTASAEERRHDSTAAIVIGDLTRTYHVHLPPSYRQSQPTPVVLAFHGGTGVGSRMPGLTGLNDAADREGFIVVYPEGIDRHWNDGRNFFKAHAAQ